MTAMFEMITEKYKENEFYRLGYRVAEKEFEIFTRILTDCLKKRFPHLINDEDFCPLKSQLVLVTFLLDFLLNSHEPRHELSPLLIYREQNQAYLEIKQQFAQAGSGSQKFQDPYFPLLSELSLARQAKEKITEEMELLETETNKQMQIIQERDEDLKKLVIQLQKELDDVNNSRQ